SGIPKDSVAVMFNTGNGTFGYGITDQFSVGSSRSLAVADVTGDGKLDLIAAGNGDSGAGASILPGNGDGTFGFAQFYPAVASYSRSHYLTSVAVGDFNGDSAADLAVADFDQGVIDVLLNTAGGKKHH